MKYRLVLSRDARSIFRRFDRTLQRRMVERFEQLCENPLAPPLSDWVEGSRDLRKSRVGGWRILFEIDEAQREVRVDAIRPRGQAYRDL